MKITLSVRTLLFVTLALAYACVSTTSRAELTAVATATLYSPEGGSFWLYYLPIEGDSDHTFGYVGGEPSTDYWVILDKKHLVDNGVVSTSSTRPGILIGSNAMGSFITTASFQSTWHSDVGIFGANAYTYCKVWSPDELFEYTQASNTSATHYYAADVP